jgi:hypothetical protein
MADEKYNGWRNVETWRVQLHLTNDEQTAAEVVLGSRPYAREADGADDPEFLRYLLRKLAAWLRAYVEARVLPEVGSVEDTWAQFSSDTLAAALERVDWEQVADHWINAPIPWDVVNTRGTSEAR